MNEYDRLSREYAAAVRNLSLDQISAISTGVGMTDSPVMVRARNIWLALEECKRNARSAGAELGSDGNLIHYRV